MDGDEREGPWTEQSDNTDQHSGGTPLLPNLEFYLSWLSLLNMGIKMTTVTMMSQANGAAFNVGVSCHVGPTSLTHGYMTHGLVTVMLRNCCYSAGVFYNWS